MKKDRHRDCQASYDAVAEEYVRRIAGELEHKPLDRELLDRFAARLRDAGPVCDMGCGPGHVTRYLHDRGLQICGYDLSLKMVEAARRLNPGIEFRQADMTALNVPDKTWAGIIAFYSIIHIPRDEMAQALGEFRRTLRPGGLLFMAFHIGDDTVHLDDWWGQKVNLDSFFFRVNEMTAHLRGAGFQIEESVEREPYPDVEHQSRRAYIFARSPAVDGRRF